MHVYKYVPTSIIIRDKPMSSVDINIHYYSVIYYAKRKGGSTKKLCAYACLHSRQVTQGFHFAFLLIYSGDLYSNGERKQFVAVSL